MHLPQYPSYGSAVPAPTSVQARPPCWGKSFDETNRECRGCGFQTSCKEDIIQQNQARRPYYGQPDYRQAAPAPIPVPTTPWSPPMPVQPPPRVAPLAVAPPPQYPVPARPPEHGLPQYGYGWVPDPLFYSVHMAPPMMRHQFPDETFMERTVKNVGLSMLEAFFGSLLLATRQMIWAPTPEEKVIDVPPQR
jgi:hypothetical protein